MDALSPIRVAVVMLLKTATTERVLDELRRAAMQVEVATSEVLHAPPSAPVYVIGVDAESADTAADQIVAWAASSALRPGLIGLIEDPRPGDPDPDRAPVRRDREVLLAAGFDDAVGAPISAREVAGRVRAVHRRLHWKGTAGRLHHGELTLDLHGRTLWVEDRTIPLTSIELTALRELMKARGRTLSRTELLDIAWGEGELEVSERAVDNVIMRLRRKLPRPELIETVRGVGFRIAASTRAP